MCNSDLPVLFPMQRQFDLKQLQNQDLVSVSAELVDSLILDDIFDVSMVSFHFMPNFDCGLCQIHWLIKTRKPEAELDDLIISPGELQKKLYVRSNASIVFRTEVKKRKLTISSPSAVVSGPKPVACPVCKQMVGCQRFAYHLQKCMGGGGRKGGQDRRRKAQITADVSTDQNASQKLNRLESDKEYFKRNPIIVRVRLNERGTV